MAAVTDPGPGGRGPDPRLRAVAVVALLCVAAVALRARQGLDWEQLAEPVEVRWARVLLGTILLLVLISIARRMLKRLRRPRPPRPGDDDHAEPEGEPISWQLKLLFGLLVLAALAVAFFVVSSLTPPQAPPPPRPRQIPFDNGSSTPGGPDARTSWTVLVLVALVLAGSALATRWAARRAQDPAGQEDLDEAQEDEVDLLVAAVDAADEGLHRHADPRAAVLAAYAAMAGQLSGGLARRGRAARRAATAPELLDRAVAAGLVDGAPARTLTELFREARFSEHPMGEDARRSALDCLARVRGELAARRG
ncbi:MAG: hypothetical protein QOD68_1694 [Actinomycetota bacterium]|nr:hypothetical protein [Actinomycetota bacterium]